MATTLKPFILTAIALFAIESSAETNTVVRTDPTQPTAVFADAMRARASDTGELDIKALVVGSDDDGAAIVTDSEKHETIVRSGSTLQLKLGSIGMNLAVKKVSSAGVEFEQTSEGGKALLSASFKALPTSKGIDAGNLRYIECDDVDIKTLLRLISDQTGVNISASAATTDTKVSLFLRNVTAEAAVEEICRSTGLWFRRDAESGMIRVSSVEEYEQSLASFREEETESFTLLYPNVIEVASVIYGLYPERVLLSLGEDEILDDEENDISRRFNRFNSIADNGGSSFLNMDAGSTSSSGSSSSGGTISFNGGRVTMVGPQQGTTMNVNDARLLREAESRGDTNAVANIIGSIGGRNANIFVTISRKNSMLMVRTSDSKAMDDIRALIKRLDVPTPMVLLEVNVLELQIDDDFVSSFQYEFAENYRTTSYDSEMKATAGYPGFNPLAGEARSDAFSFQLLSKHLQTRIQLMEKDGKARTLATPMLLTANNEVSRLFIGEERPMVKNITSQTIANGETTITVPQTEIEFQAVGTMLLITPNINADRTVTLRLLQENSEINPNGATIPIYSLTDGGLVQNVPVDVVSSRSVTGTFVAKDQMTMAVGGLIKEIETETVNRVPFLGRIPLLGWFFRSTEKIKQRTELIVMIKPHVISTPSDAENISHEVLEENAAHAAKDGRSSNGVLKHDPFEKAE